ncbi:heterokaryon incompatibility protein-domain-containing protein [Rhypophila decipiens]|uniref:Heterokaryon incompatibility protein-domain-containing protein n=1 Tax=Rhypophila decipiens TaxID=261697 RepID=A0AAN7B1D7_9PEZI|nr:heterokaryon incompatibility protein-domain-containing protein [Rhypophila decipiens]
MSSIDSLVISDEVVSSNTGSTEYLSSQKVFEPFKYLPLDPEKREIRLLKLDTLTVEDEPIQGTLETFSLTAQDCPPFRALSYEWGDYEDAVHLVVNDCTMEIRPKLMAFIECYCHAVNSRSRGADQEVQMNEYIWIDQICIDQHQIKERNHQVKLMSEIFSNVKEVIAWLGSGHEHLLDYLSSDDEFHEWCTSPALHLGYLPDRLVEFLSLSFWTRLWIQQELVLAKRVVLMSGTIWIHADKMPPELGFNSWVKAEPALHSAITKSLVRGKAKSSLPFYYAITVFPTKICADPRDKVYGIQAMLPLNDRVDAIDYELPVDKVYKQAVEVYLKTLGSVRDTAFQVEDIYRPVIDLGISMGLEAEEAMGIYTRLADDRIWKMNWGVLRTSKWAVRRMYPGKKAQNSRQRTIQ